MLSRVSHLFQNWDDSESIRAHHGMKAQLTPFEQYLAGRKGLRNGQTFKKEPGNNGTRKEGYANFPAMYRSCLK